MKRCRLGRCEARACAKAKGMTGAFSWRELCCRTSRTGPAQAQMAGKTHEPARKVRPQGHARGRPACCNESKLNGQVSYGHHSSGGCGLEGTVRGRLDKQSPARTAIFGRNTANLADMFGYGLQHVAWAFESFLHEPILPSDPLFENANKATAPTGEWRLFGAVIRMPTFQPTFAAVRSSSARTPP